MAGSRVTFPPMAGSETLEIAIDRAACRGAGECVFRAERTFVLDDEDCAKLISADGDSEEVVLAAARACPNFAIAVSRGGVRLV